jgi:hypothetical protein
MDDWSLKIIKRYSSVVIELGRLLLDYIICYTTTINVILTRGLPVMTVSGSIRLYGIDTRMRWLKLGGW